MKLGLLAPVYRERKRYGKAGNVHYLDNEEGRGVEWVLLLDREPSHAGGSQSADDNDGDSEPDAEPTEPAVHSYIVGADQRGLHDEEHNPSGEHNCVDVQDDGRERRGMYQVMVNGVAKAVHHSRGDQQRHEKIKVRAPKIRTRGYLLIRQCVRFGAHFCGPILARPAEWRRLSTCP